MRICSTLSVKIKVKKNILVWFKEQSALAAQLYNKCLEDQFELASLGKPLLSKFDLANQYRSFPLASDYKDRIVERVAQTTRNWYTSKLLRYELYWNHLEKQNNLSVEKIRFPKYPFLELVEHNTNRINAYKKHVQRLSRKQKITGMPRRRKKCSLAFSIRKNRQKTIQIKKNKLSIQVPKLSKILSGHYNFLPTSSDYLFKLATLKMDNCGTLWLRLTIEEEKQIPSQTKMPTTEKILVGVDMGLKTTRTVVAVSETSKEIKEVYQPERQRYFDLSYRALVWASTKDKRHLAFVHRKIARRRHDNIGKDIVHILSMGDSFKFGKPNSAFLLSGKLARSASDAANSLFLTRFAKRAALAGKEAGEVDESYTSQTCRVCGTKKPMPLNVRIYDCLVCYHQEDRDINSGYQIAFRDFWHPPPCEVKKTLR